ncbi:MAG: hypothetical protein NC311_00525 [Muribaculaceae bacterium]|nr:hypothetical protein [Muribaculaceae bacterium]
MSINETKNNAKNQINIRKMGKENTIANGDIAVAKGKSTKTVEKQSLLTTVVRLILDIFKAN